MRAFTFFFHINLIWKFGRFSHKYWHWEVLLRVNYLFFHSIDKLCQTLSVQWRNLIDNISFCICRTLLTVISPYLDTYMKTNIQARKICLLNQNQVSIEFRKNKVVQNAVCEPQKMKYEGTISFRFQRLEDFLSLDCQYW